MDFLELMEGDKLEASLGDHRKKMGRFNERLVGLLELITNKKGLSQNKWKYMMKEAETTSDFPILFGTILERELLGKYKEAPADWRQYIYAGTQNDFRKAQGIGIYGLQGALPAVKQRSEYKTDAQLGEGKLEIQLGKYGRAFPMSWENIINDDLGAFSDIADRLATAAKRTEYRSATGTFCTAAGPNTVLFGNAIVHPIDGLSVDNYDTLDFDVDNLGTICSRMRNFKDADNEPVIIDGFNLVVPPALEIAMLKALSAANIIMAGGDSTAGVKSQIRTSENVVKQLNITGFVNPYLPIIDVSGNADKTWYLFAKLSNGGYAGRVNFLRGHEAPELVMKNPNKLSLNGSQMSPMEGDFESDSMWWRVRHVLGSSSWDPRFAYANVGA